MLFTDGKKGIYFMMDQVLNLFIPAAKADTLLPSAQGGGGMSFIMMFVVHILNLNKKQAFRLFLIFGVPDENRTRVTAATERRSTIELRAP